MSKHPCYTTKTGIRIGCFYEPPVRQMSFQEERWQAVLLARPRPRLGAWGWVLVVLCSVVIAMWVTK